MQKLPDLPRYKRDWRQICAILPAYLPDGANGTEITYLDGTKDYLPNRQCWVLDDLLGYRRSSKSILTAQSRRLLGQNVYRVPLILCDELILVPVKGREAIGKYDSLLGYIVKGHVKLILHQTRGCRIIFTSGVELTVHDQIKTLRLNMQRASELAENLCA